MQQTRNPYPFNRRAFRCLRARRANGFTLIELAGECESQNTTVHVSGSGDVTIWAHRTLEAYVSGSGDIRYYGSPQVNSHVSGSGGVHSSGSK
jgi:Putative auto-transporter adhesin, head GIN domain